MKCSNDTNSKNRILNIDIYSFQFRGCKFSYNSRYVLVSFLFLDEFVTVATYDAFYCATVDSFLVEFFAEFEFNFGIFESAASFQRVQTVGFGQLYRWAEAVSHFPGNQTDT